MVRCFPIEAFRFHGLLSIYDFICKQYLQVNTKVFLVFLNDYKKKNENQKH